MGLFRKAIVAGVAKKVFDEARKPHNQQKIKEFIASVTDKGKGKGKGAPGERRH